MADHLTVVLPNEFGSGLGELLAQVATVVPAPSTTDADLVPLLGDADALVAARFSQAMAAAAPKLRLVQTPGAGTDGLDLGAIPPHVAVCNVFGHEAPHVAGCTDGTARYRWAEIADNMRRLQRGEPLLNVVKPASRHALRKDFLCCPPRPPRQPVARMRIHPGCTPKPARCWPAA